MKPEILDLWRREFAGYDAGRARQDLLAGLTVAAVALPLALAFGVASGASAAAGMVTAIVAGLVIGALSGAPYQISGPTGAMSAVLILLVADYGLPGMWAAGLLAGLIMLLLGLLRLGRFIAFIPAAVIAGFTSGIALLIAIGQIDNLLGVTTAPAESAALKLLGYTRGGFHIDLHALFLGVLVIAIMLFWPRRWNARFPASLLGIVVATAAVPLLGWSVPQIGAIPRSILLDERLGADLIPWAHLGDILVPALAIAALGSVESLLCGAVASNMTGIRLHANQELIGQGVGNMIIPFLGGVPATAAIARTSVGIRSGGQTRMVSIVHALALLLSVFLLAPVMALIPLAALAGVLLVTAWRMNEWEMIEYIAGHRFKTAGLTFAVTMLATITLDLTQAILIGVALSALLFMAQISRLEIQVQVVDPDRLRDRGLPVIGDCDHIYVAYLSGPLFFAATGNFHEAFAKREDAHALILSMRGVPLADLSGVQAIAQLQARMAAAGGSLMLAGLQPRVQRALEQGGVLKAVGTDRVFWGADQAILAAERRPCAHCAALVFMAGDRDFDRLSGITRIEPGV